MADRNDLLDRDDELAMLDRLVSAAGAARGAIALIEGPAGIGKSRLLAELRGNAAAADLMTVSARGSELEREYPYGVVRQLFESLVVATADQDDLLGGAASSAAAVFDPLAAPPPGADASFASLNGLYWLAVNLSARRPLVIAIDDLHWADAPSLRFVAYLLRRLDGLPILVAGTLRPAEPGADEALIAEIANDPLTTLVQPGPLGDAAVAAIVKASLGDDADERFCAACRRSTGGNPLLLRELVRTLATEGVAPTAANATSVRELGPRAVRRAVLLRLARLPEQATSVARSAAVLGDGADVAALAALAGLDEPAAARATGELARVEILRPDAPLGFVHPLVREAVYQDIGPGNREMMHARAADLLHELGVQPERVAAHILVTPARGKQWVVDTLRAAAGSALAKGAADGAVAYLRRALDERPADEQRAALVAELGMAEALTNGPAAAEHLRAAYDMAPDPVTRGWVAFVLGWTLVFTGAFVEAAALATEARDALPSADDDLAWRLEAITINARQFADPRDAEIDARLDRYREDPPGGNAGANMVATYAAYHGLTTNSGGAERVAEIALGALKDGSLVEANNGGGPWVACMIALTLSDRPETLDIADASVADAHRGGSLFAAAGAHTFRGYALLHRGDLADAIEALNVGFDGVEDWGLEPGRPYVSAYLTEALIQRGDLAGARAALGRGGIVDPVPAAIQTCWWAVARVRLLLAEGRVEEALEHADDLGRRIERVAPNPACVPWRSLRAEALGRLGRWDEAVASAREEVEPARAFGAPTTVSRALRVLGTVEREDGLDHLAEAVRLLEGSHARLDLAKALAAHGAALRRARRPTDAREPLRRALELAGVCGADPLAEYARSELQAAGVRPRSDALSGVGALTASERRVVDLAAEGGSNRDIAQALYVTPKTVEVHLSNAYRKLGIRSRRDLASVLA